MYTVNELYVESGASVEENLGLVRLCASRFKGKGIEYEELYSAGCVGLVKASKAFDEARGVRFSTYAVPVILGEIKRLFRDGGSVKVSRGLKERALKIAKIRESFEAEELREPTVEELCRLSGLDASEISECICVMSPTVSLTVEDDKELCVPTPPPDEKIINSLALEQALGMLEKDERLLIEMRFFANKTQSEVASRLGCTQVQISRREKKILSKLREML